MGFFDLFKTKGSKKKKGKPAVDLKSRFDLQARSGQGSMSKVWCAYDREVGRTVCLKLLDKEKTAKFEARFVGRNKPSEGEICMAMKHENIVRTYDAGKLKTGEPFMSMEWIEGVGLNFLSRDCARCVSRASRSSISPNSATPWSTCTSNFTCTAISAHAMSW